MTEDEQYDLFLHLGRTPAKLMRHLGIGAAEALALADKFKARLASEKLEIDTNLSGNRNDFTATALAKRWGCTTAVLHKLVRDRHLTCKPYDQRFGRSQVFAASEVERAEAAGFHNLGTRRAPAHMTGFLTVRQVAERWNRKVDDVLRRLHKGRDTLRPIKHKNFYLVEIENLEEYEANNKGIFRNG